jgi:hypothetical protein
VLRHRGEEWNRRLGKTVLVTDREDRYMCGRDRVFSRSFSDLHHHLVLLFVASNGCCSPEAKQVIRCFGNAFRRSDTRIRSLNIYTETASLVIYTPSWC